jgi:membrane protease YdiL (CAAX protease family)
MSSESIADSRADVLTLLALLVGLVAYPVLYSTDFFGRVLFSLIPGLLPRLLDETSRMEWWYFGFSSLAFHWVPFAFVAAALWKNNQRWSSIGVDWSWFNRHRVWFLGLACFLVVAAFAMPTVHYGDDLPLRSNVGFVGPVSTAERLFMIAIALTAAVTEEVIFRGFALTRLKRWIPSVWLILAITAVPFVFIHGEPRSIAQTLNYLVAGLAFGIPFILMKLRRLEIVILIHFLIDASLVLAP